MARAGLQIYTLRDIAQKDLQTAIHMISKAGFDGIEFDAGMLTRAKADQLKLWMDETGMAMIGLTILLTEISTLLEPMIVYAQKTDAEWLVMPWIDEPFRKELEQYQEVAKQLNDAGRLCADKGLRFAYHIHGYEFKLFGDKCGFDVLTEELDPEHVELQIDTFWVASGGLDVLEFSKKHISRTGSFHLKDSAGRLPLTDIEVGEGVLDIQGIVKLGVENNLDWFIVEQETSKGDLYESINKSCVNLKKMLNNALDETRF